MNIANKFRTGIVYLGLVVMALYVIPVRIFAHSGGPPYVKINSIFADTNPIVNTFLPVNIPIGSDIATSSGFFVGEPITFEIDTQFFPNPYLQAQSPFGMPVVNQKSDSFPPQFRWDFKDGTQKQEGVTVVHTYQKAGTYIIDIDVKFPGKTSEYSPVNTVQLTILPHRSYVPPKAVIHINGREIHDPMQDTASVKAGSFVKFDASASTGNIQSYQWDFGDEQGANKKIVDHRYQRDQYFPTVVLRVIDDQNIFSDTYVLVNLPFEKPNPLLSFYYAIADFIVGIFHRTDSTQ